MAAPTPERPDKRALIAQIEASRAQLASDLRAFVRAADLPSRIRERLASNAQFIALGSAAVGLVTSLLLERRPAGRPSRHRQRVGRASPPIAAAVLEWAKLELAKDAKPGGAAGDALMVRIAKAIRDALN